jgi:hypothetical protein
MTPGSEDRAEYRIAVFSRILKFFSYNFTIPSTLLNRMTVLLSVARVKQRRQAIASNCGSRQRQKERCFLTSAVLKPEVCLLYRAAGISRWHCKQSGCGVLRNRQ